MIEDKLRLSGLDDVPGLVDYANVPRVIAAAMSPVAGCAMATLHELETVYSVEDVYLMLEVRAVDSHNRHVAEEHARRKG